MNSAVSTRGRSVFQMPISADGAKTFTGGKNFTGEFTTRRSRLGRSVHRPAVLAMGEGHQ